MSRWVLWTVIILGCSVLSVAVASVFLERSACRAATGNGAIRDFHQVTAEQLDREVRDGVPLGSTRSSVESFLTSEGMKFNYDPSSRAILANAPCLKGSGVVLSSLGFTFQFGEDSKLTAIDSKVHLTGP